MISYQLHISIVKTIELQVGKLGFFKFPRGRYIYTGSAKKGIEHRVRRHLSSNKRLRWHIDYLLDHPAVKITKVDLSEKDECCLNQGLQGKVVVKCFGASDCINGCSSHLIKV